MLKRLSILIYLLYLIIGVSVAFLIKIGYETKAAAIPTHLWTFIFVITMISVFLHGWRAVLRQQAKLQKATASQSARSTRMKKRVRVKVAKPERRKVWSVKNPFRRFFQHKNKLT